MGHVPAPEPTSVGRCGLKLQLTWQHVDARLAPCLDLELVCGGTRSSGCRQRPPSPPQGRLQTHRWGQFFGGPLGYIELFTRQSMVGLLGVLVVCPVAATTKVEDVDGGPPGGADGISGSGDHKSPSRIHEVPELKVRDRPPST
jgi:hypothetical protein